MKKMGWEIVFPKDVLIKGDLVSEKRGLSRYVRTCAPRWPQRASAADGGLRSDQNAVAETGRKTIFTNDIKDYIFVEIKTLKIHHKNELKIHVFLKMKTLYFFS